MAGSHGYVQLPPDGTGKQVPQSVMIEINYDNGTVPFAVGDLCTFSVSTAVTATVLNVTGTTASGQIQLRVAEPVPQTFNFSTGENIIVSAVTNAKVLSVNAPYYFQQTVMAGKNLTNLVEVDSRGSAQVRFQEGSPQFDAFGKLQVSQGVVLGEYLNQYEINTRDFWIEQTGGGTVTHIPGNSGTLLSVGTASGDKAALTSHLYHKYQLGTSTQVEFTAASGDVGKANVMRLMGYGDINDGIFFRLNQNISVEAYMRSSTIGDHAIPSTEWNKDRLDGTGGEFNPSGAQLVPTNDNIFWIDFQWLGSGRIRFGVVLNGVRIICHEMYHGNKYTQPYMRTGSLPIHYGMSNIGTSGSSSEMRVWCSVVKTEGEFKPDVLEHFTHIRAREKQNGGTYMKAIGNWHPGRALFSIRPAATINGLDNRTVGYPIRISASNVGTSPMFIQARRSATLLGSPTWIPFHDESSMEYCEDAEIDQDNRGVQVGMWCIPPNGCENISLTDVFGYRKERILLTADNNQSTYQYTFTCWNMSPIAGGEDAGTYTVDIAAGASGAITKTAGTSFVVANYDGVAFADGQIVKLRNSTSDDGYYLISGAPTATGMVLINLDGSAVSFTGSTSDVVTIQGGTRTLFFGNVNVEEIW